MTKKKIALPIETDSQRIGQLGFKAFHIHSPVNWRIRDLSGDDDVGYDAQVQIVHDGKYTHLFHAQVKASTERRLDSTGAFYSVPLEVKTLNYFLQQPTALALVFCDLSNTELPGDCRVVYAWIHDEIRKRHGSDFSIDDPPQKKVTFRVPAASALTSETDVSSSLNEFSARNHALDGLYRSVDAISGGRDRTISVIEAVRSGAERSGALYLEAISSQSDKPWPEGERGSITYLLRRCDMAVDLGRPDEAEQSLLELTGRELDSISRAEVHFLRGRLAVWRGDHRSAATEFRKASKLRQAEGRFIAAQYETLFIQRHDPSNLAPIRALLRRMPAVKHGRVTAVRARLLAALGEFDAALALLDGIDAHDALVERMLVLYLRRDWTAAVSLSQHPLPAGTKGTARATVGILRCRCLFYLALDGATDLVIPPTGLPGTNVGALRAVWAEMTQTLQQLRGLGWPTNTQYLLDAISVVAAILGHSRDVLPDALEIARKWPNSTEVREAAIQIAVHAKEARQALELTRSTRADRDGVHDAILVAYEAGEIVDVVDAAETLLSANQSNRFHADCLLVSAVCADSLARSAIRNRLLKRLRSKKQWKDRLAIYAFVTSRGQGPEAAESALAQLIDAYRASPESITIQDHLLKAARSNDSALIIEVADRIVARRRLSVSEIERVVRASVETRDFGAAHRHIENARAQYGTLATVLGLEAVVLEAEGRSAEALAIVQRLMSDPDAPHYSRIALINIATRSGFHEEAIRQFEMLLARTLDRVEKIHYFRSLFGLLGALPGRERRMIEITRQVGQIVDKSVEEEEATFLTMYIVATMHKGAEIPVDLRQDFPQRAERFFATFPRSNYVSRFDVPESGDTEAFVASIKRVAGITPESERYFKKIENQLTRNEIAAPFCWRPRSLLRNAGTVGHLWEIAKHSTSFARAYHLLFASTSTPYEPKDLRKIDRTPLIDLTSLLVLADLDLLPLLFRVFTKVAVTKQTLLCVQRETSGLGIATDALRTIRDVLHERFDDVLQPGALLEMGRDGGLDEIRGLVRDGRFFQYSDDVCARIWVQGDNEANKGMTTVDLLSTAEKLGWISTLDASRCFAKLVRWHVGGVPIFFEHFLAAIPDEVDTARSVNGAEKLLLGSPDFRAFVDAAWSFDKDYLATLGHIGAVLTRILTSSPDPNLTVLAALIGIWLDKVQLRPEPHFSRGEHLAAVISMTGATTRSDAVRIRKVWGLYISLVERLHGSKMDKLRELDARRLLARKTAELANTDLAGANRVFEILKSGLTDGTQEYSVFVDTYADEMGKLEQERSIGERQRTTLPTLR